VRGRPGDQQREREHDRGGRRQQRVPLHPVTCRPRRVAVSALGERQGGGEQLLELVRRLGRVDIGERAHLVEELR
jgi:hypothetical protein